MKEKDTPQVKSAEALTNKADVDALAIQSLARLAAQTHSADTKINIHNKLPDPKLHEDEDGYRSLQHYIDRDAVTGEVLSDYYEYRLTNSVHEQEKYDAEFLDDEWEEEVWDPDVDEYVTDDRAVKHNQGLQEIRELYERRNFEDEHRQFEIFPLPPDVIEKYPFLSELPHDVGVMGGMARSIARKMIAGDDEPIRDIDLVHIPNPNSPDSSDDETLDKLAQTYMADDYTYGHGVQTESLDNYFRTRDVTVNST